MVEYSWDEFWWNKITGPHIVVSKVSDALLENRMVVLIVPADLPWRHTMRGVISSVFRERLSSNAVVIESIDIVDDNPENLEPGRFVLSRFASSTISRGYREKSRVSIQEYISAKEVIKNRIIWIKGIRGKAAEQWIQFCRGFGRRSVSDGLFVLEIQGNVRIPEVKTLEQINFNDYVSNYDLQLFTSFMLDSQDEYDNRWKRYISAVTASVCETDAEVAEHLLNIVDFKKQSVLDGIKTIAALPEYSRRGEDADSNHVFWYCRNQNDNMLYQRVWNAQVQVLFPLIELERVRIIKSWYDTIQEAVNNNDVIQYGVRIQDAIDVELGTLCYMMKHRLDDGLYMLYIPDETTREQIVFLHECRNSLAHASCCRTDQVTQLLS